MALLSRDQILAAKGKLKRETVSIPEFEGDVIVQEMTAADRDLYEMMIYEKSKAGEKRDNIRAGLAVFSVVNEKGERLFEEADIPTLSAMSAAALDRIYDVASRLSGLNKEDVESQVKNFESAASGASS